MKTTEGFFLEHLGIRFLSTSKDEIRAEIEGEKVVRTTTPIHLGKSTMVWQTRIERDDGKLVALVTQTQMVLAPSDLDTKELFGTLQPSLTRLTSRRIPWHRPHKPHKPRVAKRSMN